MFCRLNEYWCKQAVMWWRLGRWKRFLIAQIAFRDFVFFHIRSEVKMEFTAQNMNFVLSWNTWMNLKDLFSHAQQSQRWSLICKTVTRENASVLAPQGMSLPSLRLCLTAFKLFFREDTQTHPSSVRSFKKNILLLAGNTNAFFMTNWLNKSTYAWWWEEFKLLFILTQQRSDSVTPLPEKTEKRGVRENRLVINRAVMHKLSGPAL